MLVSEVSRIEAQSDKFDAYILLDVNIDVYRINKDKRYTIGLATTLDLDGTPDTGYYNQVNHILLFHPTKKSEDTVFLLCFSFCSLYALHFPLIRYYG